MLAGPVWTYRPACVWSARIMLSPGSPGSWAAPDSTQVHSPDKRSARLVAVARFARLPGLDGDCTLKVGLQTRWACARFIESPGSPGCPIRQVCPFARFMTQPIWCIATSKEATGFPRDRCYSSVYRCVSV